MGAERERYERQQSILVELSTDESLKRGDFERTVARITEVASRELGVARVSVWLFDERRSAIRCVDLYDGAGHTRGVELSAKDYPGYFAAMTQHRILAADDAHTDARTREFSQSYLTPLGIHSMLDAPVRVHGELAGVLCHEHVGSKRTWSIDEQMFAASLADLVAQAHSSAKVHQDPPLADLTGEHALGRYELVALLGRGGMAEVYLAVAEARVAVLKRIRGTLAQDLPIVAMLRDEAQVAMRLRHPNVVRTLDVGEYKDSTFIVMEFIDGQTLGAIAARLLEQREPRPEPAFWGRVICDALAGLHYAHVARDEQGRPMNVVHRDVSPQNLMITYEGVTKVVDFGIAKTSLDRQRTETGILKGRIGYMAPEQYEGDPVDHRADVYSIGVVLWELLTGERYRDTGSMRRIERAMKAPAPPIRRHEPRVTEALEAAVMKALSNDPDERQTSAEELRMDLERALPSMPDHAAVGAWVRSRFATEREDIARRLRMHGEPRPPAAK